MLNRLLIAILASLFFSLGAVAQVNPFFQKKIEKKLRTNLEDFVAYVSTHPNAKPLKTNPSESVQIESRDQDKFINFTPEPESEFHAAINPTDTNNIIICSMRNNPENFLAPLTFPVFYTKDFGATWEVSEFDGTTAGSFIIGGGDPIIVFDTEGTAYLCWLTLTTDLIFSTTIALRYAYSTDGGATWTEIKEPLDSGNAGSILDILGGGDVNGDFKFVDKEWLSVDRSNSPFRNTIYASYLTIETFGDSLVTNITLRKKTAESTTFTDSSVVVNTTAYKLVQFTSIDVDNEGTVHVTFAGTPDSLNWQLYYTNSKDGGATFLPESKIADFHIPRLSGDEPESNIIGIDGQRLYPCPQLAVDKSDLSTEGNLYFVWTANGGVEKKTEGLDIYFSRSTDGGRTWATPSVLNDDGLKNSHQFYPSIAINEKGKIVISWYDRRDDPENIQTLYYMTYSENGGETFVPNFAVSTAASDFSKIGDKNAAFGIGEYTQTLATSHYGIPIWADGRTNDGNIDIYLALVPLDGNSAVTSVQTVSPTLTVNGPNPNPFGVTTQVQVNLKTRTELVANVFSIDGKLVKTVANGTFSAGIHTLNIQDLAIGEYILTIQTNNSQVSKKLISR